MYDWYDRIQWNEISALLNSGHPSILQQLIVVNLLSIAVIVFIRLKHRNILRNRPKYFLQEILLLANMIILSEDQFSTLFYGRVLPFISHFRQLAM